MKGELTKREGFRTQNFLTTGYWILNPSTKIVNRIPGNPGKNYQDIAR